MRLFLASLVFVGGFSASQAQRIDSVDVAEVGIYTLSKTKTIQDSTISTGERTEATTATLTQATTVIVAGDGVVFGLRLNVRGRPSGASVPVRVKWHYPQPGLINPTTRVAKFVDDYPDQQKLGTSPTYYWTLGDPWTQVPGEWIFELFDGNRPLVKQSFTLQATSSSSAPPSSSVPPSRTNNAPLQRQ